MESSILTVVKYSDQFDFPLTDQEIWLWSPSSCQISQIKKNLSCLIAQRKLQKKENFYFLPGRTSIVGLRIKRKKISKSKWSIAQNAVSLLRKIPTIELIAVTGSLTVNNSIKNDDVDLMIVTSPNTLWFTRFVVWLVLSIKGLRRAPLTKNWQKFQNKICDNLYLDSSHMTISQSLNDRTYLAHEILQAIPLFDRASFHRRFLVANLWVAKLFPNSFRNRVESSGHKKSQSIQRSRYLYSIFYPMNLIFFLVQFVYMLPKKTIEKVSLYYAFFHPTK